MNLRAFLTGANIVTVNKNKKYGMTCAWAMQTDFDKVMLLIGEQSETGKQISIGDTIGISALARGQEEIARIFGNSHSTEIDKFDNQYWYVEAGAILIKDAAVNMIIDVKNIIKLEDNDDILIYGYIKSSKANDFEFIDYKNI